MTTWMVLLGHLFDDYKVGLLTKAQAIGTVTHIVTALDAGNLGEVQTGCAKATNSLAEAQRKDPSRQLRTALIRAING